MAKRSDSSETPATESRKASRPKKAASGPPRQSDETPEQADSAAPSPVQLNINPLGLPTVARPFLVEYFPSPEQMRAELEVRASELARSENRAKRVRRRIAREWYTKYGLMVNVAPRSKFGQVVAPLQFVLQVDVRTKYSIDYLRQQGMFIVPCEVDGVPTQVREIRFVSSLASVAGVAETVTAVDAPVQGGAKIAPVTTPDIWGTLGICVPEQSNPANQILGITNHHVAGSVSTNIQHPSGTPPIGEDWVIGAVFKSKISPFVDAASVKGRASPARELAEGILGLPYAPGDYRFATNIEMSSSIKFKQVSKVGAKTGPRDGIVINESREFSVPALLPEPFQKVIEFNDPNGNLITDAGDSGAAVVLPMSISNKVTPVVIGLNFAMSDDRKNAYAIPFGSVLKRLGITLAAARLIKL